MTQQRDAIKLMSPPWLDHGTGERYMYNIGLAADAILEKLNQGVKARMPTECDATALPIIGSDRVMPQYPGEADASYRVRLQEAFDTWRTSGSRGAVMSQALAFLNETVALPGVVPVVGIVGGNLSENWDITYNNGQKSHVQLGTQNWDWDGANYWWRCWLILYMTLVPTGQNGATATIFSVNVNGWEVALTGLSGMTPDSVGHYLTVSGAANTENNGTFQIVRYFSATSVSIANPAVVWPDANSGAISWVENYYPTIGPAPVWDAPGATWDDPSRSWGLNVPSTTIDGIRSLLRLWKSAGSYYRNIILCFGGADGEATEEFSPYSTMGAGNPDGTWGPLSANIGGVMKQTRLTGAALGIFNEYCGGSGSRVNCTIENVT